MLQKPFFILHKFFIYSLLIAFAYPCLVAHAASSDSTPVASLEEIMVCPMGRNGEHSLRLYRRPMHIGEGYIYYLQSDTENARRLGQIRKGQAICVGQSERIFVLTTNNARHIAPYGIRYNSNARQWQTVTLPSDKPPLYAYLNDLEFLLVGEETASEERAGNYVVARSWASKSDGDLEILSLETLPSFEGYEVLPLSGQTKIDTTKHLILTKHRIDN